MGFFDVENRYAALDAKRSPGENQRPGPLGSLRSRLENVWRKPPAKRKSNAGWQTPVQAGGRLWDAIVLFKAILRCAFCYKNHVNIDRRHKLFRRYRVTDASVHDSQAVDDLLTSDNTASGVWADSTYRRKTLRRRSRRRG